MYWRGAILSALCTLSCVATLFFCPFSSAQDEVADAQATRKYSVALGFQKKKLFDQAAPRWQQFIQTYPQHKRTPTAYHHLGVCQIQQQKHAEAANTFRTILSKFPQFTALDSTHFNLGLAIYNAALASQKPADFNQAATTFGEVSAKFGNSPLVPTSLFYRAECLCLAGDFKTALPVYQNIVNAHPNSPVAPRALYALGATQQDLEMETEATATYQSFLQKFPQDSQVNDCRLRLGDSLCKQQRFAEAEPIFAQAAGTADFANADFAVMKYAQSLFEQDKLPQAAAQYESLPGRFKESEYIGAAYLAAGKCRYRNKEFPPAQNNFTAAVNLKQPDTSSEAAYWLARTLRQLKNPNGAIQTLDQAIAAYPQSEFRPLCQFGRIDAIFSIEARQKEAVPLFAQFAAQNAAHEKAPEALYRAALGSLQLQDYPNAQKYTATYLANPEFMQHPLGPEVLLSAAESYLRPEPPDLGKAEAFYRRLISEFPQHDRLPRAQLGIGVCLHAAKKYEPAIQQLTTSAPLFTDPIILAESRLLIGRCFLETERAEQAIGMLQSARAAKPDWEHVDEVIFVLGLSMRSAGQADPAIATFNELNAAHPQSLFRGQGICQVGEIRFQNQKYDEAIAAYQSLISQLPQDPFVPQALYGMAAAKFEKLDFAGAQPHLDQLIGTHAVSPIAPRGKYLRGLCRLRLSQFQPALTDLTEFIATTPEQTDLLGARYALARCQIGLKQLDPAIALLQSILNEKPDYARADEIYYELGFAYLDAMKTKEAADNFRQLAEKLPQSSHAAESWYRVGEFHETVDQFPAAIAAYTSGLKIPAEQNTESTIREKLQYKLGAVQYKQEQYGVAIQTLQQQVNEFGQGELAEAGQYLLGESFYREKNYPEAMARFAKVIGSARETAKEFHARSYYRSGVCAAFLKQWAASQQHYAALVNGFPDFEVIGEARYGLGMALQHQQKLDEAKGVFQQVINNEPETETAAKSWFMIGQCWFTQKNYAKAIDCFSEVAFGFKHEEWQPLSYFEAGRCYIQLMKPAAAQEMLKTVVDEFPNHARVADAKAILAELNQ